MLTRDSITIQAPLKKVYDTAANIGIHHEYMPGYLPSNILERNDEYIIIERNTRHKNETFSWKSKAVFNEDKDIRYHQLEGRLKGMNVLWEFKDEGSATTVIITHEYSMPLVFPFNLIVENWIAKPKVDAITHNVLAGMKRYIESDGGDS